MTWTLVAIAALFIITLALRALLFRTPSDRKPKTTPADAPRVIKSFSENEKTP
ncbi:MAG: hypothetical protein DHS20C14_09590 [Phycisphaeraceae bacterium]|nr:MAG: hypothetical protein DHS20C14_09590 [Phycisphaeraceae bacterium]